MTPRLVPVLAVLALVAGCSNELRVATSVDPSPPERPAGVPAASGQVTTIYPVTVIEREDSTGPQMCVGVTLTTYPPTCGGPALIGWDWDEHLGDYTSFGGGVVRGRMIPPEQRFGDFLLTGTFDGIALTVTSALPAREFVNPGVPASDMHDFDTPCPEPDGGWRVLDQDKVSQRRMSRTLDIAAQLSGHERAWMDRSRNPLPPGFLPYPGAPPMTDPAKITLNVQITGDTAAADRELRKTWGGALCVSHPEHTKAELRQIEKQLRDVPGYLHGSDGIGHVYVDVLYDDGSLQEWADATFGPDLVRVSSNLVDVEQAD